MIAVRYYFRREIETDKELFQGLVFTKVEALQEAQEKGFAALTDVLSRQGQRLEGMLGEVMEVLKDVWGTGEDTNSRVRRLEEQIRKLLEILQLQGRELRPGDSVSVRSAGEQQRVREIVGEYRDLPTEERQKRPDLRNTVGVLEAAAGSPSSKDTSPAVLYLKSKGIEAKGYEVADGFLVLARSQAVERTVPSIAANLVELRNTLTQKGVLVQDRDVLTLVKNYVFDSPSSAAGVMLGRNANGRVEWKDEHGKSLKEIQAAGDADDSAVPRLTLWQIRILQRLVKEGRSLPRPELVKAATGRENGTMDGSTLGCIDPEARKVADEKAGRPSLLTLGFVRMIQATVEGAGGRGREVTEYEIADAGREALAAAQPMPTAEEQAAFGEALFAGNQPTQAAQQDETNALTEGAGTSFPVEHSETLADIIRAGLLVPPVPPRVTSDKPDSMTWRDAPGSPVGVASWKEVLIKATERALALGLPPNQLPMRSSGDGRDLRSPHNMQPGLSIETHGSSSLIRSLVSTMLKSLGKGVSAN